MLRGFWTRPYKPPSLRGFRQRWPLTSFTLSGLACATVIIVGGALWKPVVYIALGLFVLYMLTDSIRRDRRWRREDGS